MLLERNSFDDEGWPRSATPTMLALVRQPSCDRCSDRTLRYYSDWVLERVMGRLILKLLTISTGLLLSFSSLAPGATTMSAQQRASTADSQDDEFYVCPMHPDVTSDKPGKCPKCAMTLVRTRRPEMAEYEVKLATTPAVVKPSEKFRLTFFISHPRTGQPVKEFNIVHDMPFHLFVVSQDLTYFAHIHPQQQADGRFTIETTVPKAGSYIIYCDIFPVGGMPWPIAVLSQLAFTGIYSLRRRNSCLTRFLRRPLLECGSD